MYAILCSTSRIKYYWVKNHIIVSFSSLKTLYWWLKFSTKFILKTVYFCVFGDDHTVGRDVVRYPLKAKVSLSFNTSIPSLKPRLNFSRYRQYFLRLNSCSMFTLTTHHTLESSWRSRPSVSLLHNKIRHYIF